MKQITVKLYLMVDDDADDEEIGEAVFDLVASDPFDNIPAIQTVDGWDPG